MTCLIKNIDPEIISGGRSQHLTAHFNKCPAEEAPSGLRQCTGTPPQLSSLYLSCTFWHVLSPHSVTPTMAQVSNMKAQLPAPTLAGLSSAFLAPSPLSASGPCPLMVLCRLAPPGTNPPDPRASRRTRR
ncbi:hypothetical protein Ct61P_11919 [Colletotrichum tofieldiae]|nr:hypothetical protein Ct61P_11919 [Colletotrichum tofieldiae]